MEAVLNGLWLPYGYRVTSQIGHEEWEGGQQGMKIDEYEKVDQAYLYEGAVHSFS